MKQKLSIVCAAALFLVVFAFTQPVRTQTMGQPEEFTAGAIDINHGRTGQIQITVNRWSTPAERAKLITALLGKGQEELLKVLQDTRLISLLRDKNTLQRNSKPFAKRPSTPLVVLARRKVCQKPYISPFSSAGLHLLRSLSPRAQS